MALYIPHSIFHLARLLYVRLETFGPYCVFAFVESANIIIGKESSSESDKWKKVQRTGRNEKESERRKEKRMKARLRKKERRIGTLC